MREGNEFTQLYGATKRVQILAQSPYGTITCTLTRAHAYTPGYTAWGERVDLSTLPSMITSGGRQNYFIEDTALGTEVPTAGGHQTVRRNNILRNRV